MTNPLLPIGNVKLTPSNLAAYLNIGVVPVSPPPPPPSPPTCFPAGSMVMMQDGSMKPIENIVIEDQLMSADGKPAKIKKIDTPVLGHRKMISFKEDPTIKWSEEHLFWAKKNNKQWWWTYNHQTWLSEVQVGAIAGLKDNYSHFTDHDVEFAHLSGFVKRTVVDVSHEYSEGAMTQLYLPVTENGEPIIINGYIVAAGADEFQYDYTKFDWDESRKHF